MANKNNDKATQSSTFIINQPPVYNIVQNFAEKTENKPRHLADDLKSIIQRIYISASWNQRRHDDIATLADMLRSCDDKFDVIADQRRTTGLALNTQVEAKICHQLDKSQLFLLIFDEAYKTNAICRLEFNYAQRRRKHILPIKVMTSTGSNNEEGVIISSNAVKELIIKEDGWLPYPLDDTRWIEFNDDKELPDLFNEINQRLRFMFTPKAKLDPLRSAKPLHAIAFRNKTFTTVNVPSFSHYFNRKADEDYILRQIREISKQEGGCLSITGESGVGKTALMAYLFSEPANNDSFFVRRCNINVVIWVNCWKWRHADQFDLSAEEAFLGKLMQMAEQAARQLSPTFDETFFDLDCAAKYFHHHEKQQRRVMFVLDDFANSRIIECLRNRFKAAPFNFVTIATASSDNENDYQDFATKTYLLKSLTDERLFVDMLEICYKMDGKLTRDQMSLMASKLCNWSPLVGSIASCYFTSENYSQNCANDLEALIEKTGNQPAIGSVITLLTKLGLERLETPMRNSCFAFLLFEPGEPVAIDDLTMLWGFASDVADGKVKSRALCRVFECEGLILKRDADHFSMHRLQFEAALEVAKTVFETGTLEKLRYKIATGRVRVIVDDFANDRTHILSSMISQTRYRLLFKIFQVLSVNDLIRICAHKTEAHSCRTFLQFLFDSLNFDDDNVLPRLLWLVCERLGRPKFVAVLRQEDDDGHSLFVQLFRKLDSFSGRSRYVPLLKAALHPWRYDLNEGDWLTNLTAQTASMKSYVDPVEMAALCGDLTTLEDEFRSRNYFNETTLSIAARRGHFDAVLLLTKIRGDKIIPLAKPSNYRGTTPLTYAARNGHIEIVKCLSESYPQWIDIEDSDGWTPLMHALVNNRISTARFLVEKGSKIGEEPKLEKVLFGVSANGHVDSLQFIFDHGFIPYRYNLAKLRQAKNNGRTLMHVAVMNGQLAVARILHEKTARNEDSERLIQMRDDNETSPLACAVSTGCLDVVRYIHAAFPDAVKVEDLQGATPLFIATAAGHTDVVRFLYEKFPDAIFQCNREDTSPLMCAVKAGFSDLVRFIYARAPDAAKWLEAKLGQTPVFVAAACNHLEITAFLSKKCPEALKLKNKAGLTPLAASAANGQFEICKILLENCPEAAQIEAGLGEVPLMFAARNGHTDVVQLLFEHYPDAVKLVNKDGLTSAAQAALMGHFDVVQFLIDK